MNKLALLPLMLMILLVSSSMVLGAVVQSGAEGSYDVLVDTYEHRYLQDEVVTSNITIFNTGGLPDEDTILIYYLVSPDGKRYGESKEQILEVPVGKTYFQKEIALPVNTQLGEWRFYVEYNTVVQPQITVYDGFEVVKTADELVEEETIFDKEKNVFNNSIEYIKDKDNLYTVIAGIVILLALILLAVFLSERRDD